MKLNSCWILFILQSQVLSIFLPQLTINGSGATFPGLVYAAWQNIYKATGAMRGLNTTLNYDQIGSGSGRKQILSKSVHFAGSDGNASETEWTKNPNFRMFPTLAGSVVLGYNIPGDNKSTPLVLSRAAIVGIYNGSITSWNDPEILSTNQFLVPLLSGNQPIYNVKRSEKSGTTQIFTTALSSFESAWSTQYGAFQSTSDWPNIGNSLTGEGNSGVAITILTNEWSIGYLEQAVADQFDMQFASIINLAGNIVAPSVAGIRSAISDFSSEFATVNPKVFYVNIVDGPSSETYPIVGFTYLCFLTDHPDNSELKTLTKTFQYELFRFFYWTLTDSSAASAAAKYFFATVGSVPAVQEIAINILSEVAYNSTDTTPMISRVIEDVTLEQLILSRPYCADGCVHGTCTNNATTGIGYCLCENTWNGTTCSNRDLPVIVTDIPVQPVYAGLTVLSAVLFMFTCISGVVVRANCHNKIVRASGKNLSYGIVTFVGLGHFASLIMLELPTDSICGLRVFLIPAVISCLLFTYSLKIYRVFYVFGNSKKIITSSSPAISQLTFLGYNALIAIFLAVLALVWIYYGAYNASILRTVDNYYFYTGCATGNSTVSGAILAIYFVWTGFILAVTFFAGVQLSRIPKQFVTVSHVNVTIGVLAVGLLALFVNQLVNYSEYIKNIVFVGIFSIILQTVHYSSVLSCTRRVLTQQKSSLRSVESQEDETRINLTSLVDKCKEALNEDPSSLVAPCTRLSPGFFSRWADDILVFNPKNGYMTFENVLIPGNYTTFNVKTRDTWIEIPGDFGIELQKTLEFSLIEYGRKHSVIVNIPPGREGRARWIHELKRLATTQKKLEPKSNNMKAKAHKTVSPQESAQKSEPLDEENL